MTKSNYRKQHKMSNQSEERTTFIHKRERHVEIEANWLIKAYDELCKKYRINRIKLARLSVTIIWLSIIIVGIQMSNDYEWIEDECRNSYWRAIQICSINSTLLLMSILYYIECSRSPREYSNGESNRKEAFMVSIVLLTIVTVFEWALNAETILSSVKHVQCWKLYPSISKWYMMAFLVIEYLAVQLLGYLLMFFGYLLRFLYEFYNPIEIIN
jgi:hypothetical protein